MARVLYIGYWGVLEPLGQSLIIPPIITLAGMGAEITLISFEKPSDLGSRGAVARATDIFRAAGVKWIPLRYHKSPKMPATAFDIVRGLICGMFEQIRGRFDIVHARTYIGGLIGLILAPLIGAKLIYHNEGFYPDEQVDGGVWQKGSRTHRFAKWLENRMYVRADGIIALSNRAKTVIEEITAVSRRGTPVIVVPSCVDLEHFQISASRVRWDDEVVDMVYIGSVGDRYTLDDIGRFISTINSGSKKASLQIYSRADYALINRMLASGGMDESGWTLRSAAYSEMPSLLVKHQVGLFFLRRGISELGCSPTKIGEYWASGLPVITTPSVSDTDEIIRTENVGVIVRDQSIESYKNAFKQIKELLGDPDLAARCRLAAEKHYSLTPACERQMSLYKKVARD